MLFVQIQQAPVADLVVKAVQQPQAAPLVAAGKVKKPRRSRRGELPTRFSPRQQDKKLKAAAETQARLCLQELGIIPQEGAPAAPQLPAEQLPADEHDQDMTDSEDVSLFFNLLFLVMPERVIRLSSQLFFCQQYYSRIIFDICVSIII